MKRFFLVIAVAAMPLFGGCRPAAAPVSISRRPMTAIDGRRQSASEKPVDELAWTRMDGGEQRIGDLKDKVLILDFWATYCPPCLEEIPHLNSLQAKYGEKLLVVGLNVGGEDDRPKIPAFIKQLKVSYPIAFPEDALLSFISGDDDRIPQTAVFDRQGNLIQKFVGFDPAVKTQLDRAVESAMSE